MLKKERIEIERWAAGVPDKELEKEYYNRFLGQELEVILEERNKKTNLLSGFTSNYLKLSSDLSDDYIGKIVKLKVS